MSTGYTHRVIEGEIDNLEDFAKLCMRAFGAVIHMREDSLDVEYYPPTQSTYYKDALKRKMVELEKMKNQKDEQIVQDMLNELNEREEQIKEGIDKTKKIAEKLTKLIAEVIMWDPPTEDHQELKQFMLDQLHSTLDMDGNPEYYENELREVQEKKKIKPDPKKIRESTIKAINRDIKYYEQQQREDIKRCNDRTEWIEQLLNSFKK